MNIATKRAEWKREGQEILAELLLVEKSTNRAVSKALERQFAEWEAAGENLDFEDSRRNVTGKYASLKAFGGDLGNAPAIPTTKATGATNSPFFSTAQLRAAHKAFLEYQPFTATAEKKAFSTVEPLLPAQLAPGVVEHIHEWRILDRLPVTAIDRPSYEFIVHNFAGDTLAGNEAPFNPPVVQEGATKPEYIPAVTQETTTVTKLALHTGISRETLLDFDTWLGYITTECYKQIADSENQQLLYGTGSNNQVTGLFNTSGILTHDVSSDPGGYTALDSVEASIEQMRAGNSLAEPNLFITSPSVWAAMRRIKSTTGEYVAGDPLRSAVNTIWGIPVLTTTAISPTAGQGLLLDTTKFGTALVREGIGMIQGYSGTDFVQNVVRWVFEERIGLAVFRPQAVLSLAHLPVS